jgi:subtilisin family serine protease
VKPHLRIKLREGAVVLREPPHWTELIEDKSRAEGPFHGPLDRELARHGTPVWVAHEYRPEADAFSAEEIASGLNRVYRLILQVDGRFPPDLIRDISLLPTIEYVRPGAVGVADLPAPQLAQASSVPDSASRQAIYLDEARAYGEGDPSVKVAVLDTGVDLDHPELEQVLVPGYDFVNIIDGAERFLGDYLDADETPSDEVGHGTHVAGIVAGLGLRMPAGVVPRCKIVPVRVLGALQRGGRRYGAGLIDNISAGIKWAVDQGVEVLSMSLGVEPVAGELPHEEVVDYARRKGVSIVAASGNDGTGTSRYYPGALPYAITVGAFDDQTGDVTAFSTYGDQVDFVAPGTNVYSSWLGRSYAYSSGTSQATPFVTGAAALLHSIARSRGARMTDGRVKYVLKNTADRVDRRFRSPKAGFGRLNLIDAARLLDHKLD